MISITTTNSSDAPRGYTMLPPGFYHARIVDALEGKSNKGTPYIQLELSVDDGSGAETSIKDWVYITDKAMWRIENLLAACGKVFGAGERVDIDANKLIGRKLRVATYKQTRSNGNIYAGIRSYLRAQDMPHEGAMTPEELENWGLLPDGTMESEKPNRPQQPQRQPYERRSFTAQSYSAPTGYASTHNGQQPEEDDDIPF